MFRKKPSRRIVLKRVFGLLLCAALIFIVGNPLYKKYRVSSRVRRLPPQIKVLLPKDVKTLSRSDQKRAAEKAVQAYLNTPLPSKPQNWPKPLGGHNDFDSVLYEKYFGQKISYAAWKNLPTGVRPADQRRAGVKAFVLTMTTWPARTHRGTPGIWLTIESLMRQTEKPDRILLWLSREEYPGERADLPQTLLDLERRGLEIMFIDGNLKAAKKLLPALQAGIKANLITVDDDIVYGSDFLSCFAADVKDYPGAVLSVMMRDPRIKKGVLPPYSGFSGHRSVPGHYPQGLPLGCVGVLYPYDPSGKTLNGLDKRVIDPEHSHHALTTDDLWFMACRIMAGTSFYVVRNPCPPVSWCTLGQALFDHNSQGGNDKAMLKLLMHFPKLVRKLGLNPNKVQCGLALIPALSPPEPDWTFLATGIKDSDLPYDPAAFEGPKPKLILHIGPYKTATTAFQTWMSWNRAKLLEKGIFFPVIYPEKPSSWGGGGNSAEFLRRFKFGRCDQLEHYFKSIRLAMWHKKASIGVVSSEFWSRFSGNHQDDLLASAQKFFEVKIVCAVRELGQWAVSFWAEDILRDTSRELLESAKHKVRFLDSIKQWLDQSVDIIFISFDAHKKDFFQHFLSAADFPIQEHDYLELGYTANRSFSESEINLILLYKNAQLPAYLISDAFYQNKKRHKSGIVKPARYYDKDLAAYLYNKYGGLLRRINTYLPDGEKLPTTLAEALAVLPPEWTHTWNHNNIDPADIKRAFQILAKNF